MNKKKTEHEIELPKDPQKEEVLTILKKILVLLDEIAKNTFPGH